MGIARDLADFAHVANEMMGRNRIINGGFDVWQRGTSFSATGYTADRWRLALGSGAAVDVSRQAFTLGQTDVPGEPRYYLEFDRTTAGSAASTLEQRIESVRTLAGREITVSFYAKASSAVTLNTLLRQHFGTSGSPSSDVDSDAEGHSLTTSWQRFTHTLTLASISGKTLGSDANDYLGLRFSLPDSEGAVTVDIANVQVESGNVATPFEDRPLAVEIRMCQRYFWRLAPSGAAFAMAVALGIDEANAIRTLPTRMRVGPTVTFSGSFTFSLAGSDETITAANMTSFSHLPESVRYATSSASGLTAGEGGFVRGVDSDSIIDHDAEF